MREWRYTIDIHNPMKRFWIHHHLIITNIFWLRNYQSCLAMRSKVYSPVGTAALALLLLSVGAEATWEKQAMKRTNKKSVLMLKFILLTLEHLWFIIFQIYSCSWKHILYSSSLIILPFVSYKGRVKTRLDNFFFFSVFEN